MEDVYDTASPSADVDDRVDGRGSASSGEPQDDAAETESDGQVVELVDDVYGIILSLLDFRFMASLACTCRGAYRALRKEKRLRFGRYRLSPMQAHIRDTACSMPDALGGATNIFTGCAPMGFGKTATGYSIAFADPEDNNHYVFVVPPKAFDTWAQEAIKIFGTVTGAVTAKTRVLFAHSSQAQHLRHIKDVSERAGDQGTPDFGPRIRALVTTSSSKFGMGIARRWATRVIIDEAHAVTTRTWNAAPSVRWKVLLSANDIYVRTSALDVHWGGVTIAAKYMELLVPRVELRRSVVKAYVTYEFDESRQYTTPDQKIDSITKNLDEYCRALRHVMATIPKGQIALYLPDGEAGDAIAAELERIAPDWTIITFVAATKKIRQFESYSHAILVVRLNKSEAINILASHLVIVRPDWVNPVRYAQLIGRVLRPTNTNKKAIVYSIAPHGTPTLRLAYYEALRCLMTKDLQLEIPHLRASELEKADATLRLCGSSLERAAPAEVVAAVGTGFDHPATSGKVLEHWRDTEKPTLTKEHMLTLLGTTEKLLGSEVDELLGELLGP